MSDAMALGMTERLKPIHSQVADMIRDEILPLDEEFLAEVGKGDRWQYTARQKEILEGLKSKAKERGLWNFWLTDSDKGYGLSTVEYAYLAEEMGKAHLGAEVFNCSAPDTGNMEVFERYASEELKKKWLLPLLDGEIRSAYLMTEPDVASSDATNISMACVRDGDEYVLNGEKWWSSGAGDPRCAVYIVMVNSPDDSRRKHQQHSMIVVDAKTPGIEILRAMQVYGEDDAPHGHMHIRFKDVRVPAENMLLGEGRGFEIAQGRLGPGRIHHCMRAIGQAERALEQMCQRSVRREAFGKPLAKLGANYDIIANCRMEIEQARLLCLKAAWMMDQGDARAAAPWISQIKVIAPQVALKVIDEAVQMFGAQGVSQDTSLARAWTHVRTLRLADGPDAVHRMQVARAELRQYTQEKNVMRAIVCEEFGPIDKIKLADMPDPEPGPKEIVIDAEAIGVNFPDGLLVQGLYQVKPPTPFVPGMELVGTVSAAGAESGFSAGDRVAAITSIGAYAEKVKAHRNVAMPVPHGADAAELTALLCGYGTAHHALKQRGQLKPGETLAVTGAAGLTGLAAVQIGKAMGAKVIAIASSEEKRKVCEENGADITLGYENLKDTLKEATDGKGADVIFEVVGGDVFHACSRAINWGGRLLVIGFADGDIPKFPINLALVKGSALVGVFWGSFVQREPEVYAENMKELFAWYGEGKIKPLVEQVFKLEDAVDALQHIHGRKAKGKVVLAP